MGIKRALVIDEPLPDLFCGLCQDILDDPVQVHCPEDHIFCSKCIETYLQQSTTCPHCMTDLDPTLFQPSKFVQRQVGRLRVRCIYHEAGCTWQGFFSDPHPEQCGFGLQECPNEGCKERLSRMDLQQHECPYELLTCPNLVPLCKPFYRKDKETHEKTCRSYPCHYAMAGCPFIGTLEDVNTHCDVYCGKLHQRIKDLEAECERLKKCLGEPEATSEQADDEDMGGIQLLEQMLSGNNNYLSLGLLNDKQDTNDPKPPPPPAPQEQPQQQQQQQPQQQEAQPLSLLNTDLMDLSDCLPPISFDKPPLSAPISAPKRSSNGQIIRYSRNVRLAHRTLRMARQQQNRYMSNEYPFENLLEDLDVAIKPDLLPADNPSTPMNAATPASVSSQQEDLANMMAQQSLSSPQHNPFSFNNLEDVTKYLSDLAPPPAQEEKPTSPAYTTPVAQSPLRNSSSAKTTKSNSTSNRTPRKPEAKKDKKKMEPVRSPPPPSSPTNATSPPTDGPKKRPMFVLASTYLANYGGNKQQPS